MVMLRGCLFLVERSGLEPGPDSLRKPAERLRCESEEQQNEREMAFNATHKKVAASDMTLAAIWWRWGELNPRPKAL